MRRPMITALVLALVASATSLHAQTVVVPTFTAMAAQPEHELVDLAVTEGVDGSLLFFWSEAVPGLELLPLMTAGTIRRSASGTALGPPFLSGSAGRPMIELHAGPSALGGYAVTWNTTFGHGLLGRLLDADGTVADGFLPNYTFAGQLLGSSAVGSSLAVLPDGPILAWDEMGPITARRFDIRGRAIDYPFLVGIRSALSKTAVAARAGGGFVIAWGAQIGNDIDIRLRAFDDDALPLGDQVSLVPSTRFAALGASPVADALAVVGTRPLVAQPTQLWLIRATSAGVVLGPEILVDGVSAPAFIVEAAVATDLSGNLYVAWLRNDGTVSARGYDPDGVTLGAPIVLTTDARSIEIARRDDGRFVNAWRRASTAEAAVVSLCQPGSAVCGDGVVVSTCEQCDDGAGNSDVVADACRTNCRRARCGDGVVDGGEACDDGNRVACDGCDQRCRVEAGPICGDGVLNELCGEACDDGNAVGGDGCTAECAFERIPGGGARSIDCLTEWVVSNPGNVPLVDKRGDFNAKQRCTDDDPACDFDGGVPGGCTFRVRACGVNTNLRPTCFPSRLATLTLERPSESQAAKAPALAAVRAAFAAGIPGQIVGPDTRDLCSDPVDVRVPLRVAPGAFRPGKLVFQTRAETYGGPPDKDKLLLTCVP